MFYKCLDEVMRLFLIDYNSSYKSVVLFMILTGFLPRDTAKHHQEYVLKVLNQAMEEAQIQPNDVDVICYTKGKTYSKIEAGTLVV